MILILGPLCCETRLDRVGRVFLVFARSFGCAGLGVLNRRGSGRNRMRILVVVGVFLIRNASVLVLSALIVLSGRTLPRRVPGVKVSPRADVLGCPRVASSSSHMIFVYETAEAEEAELVLVVQAQAEAWEERRCDAWVVLTVDVIDLTSQA
jgi:hypothetical protein